MFEKLKLHFQNAISLTSEEIDLIDQFFEEQWLEKKSYYLKEGDVCKDIAFIDTGTIRHFHVKDGNEKTCDISFAGSWITDYKSFTNAIESNMYLVALHDTRLNLISKENLYKLYQACSKYETFGRQMAEQIAQNSIDLAMSLSSQKPEERFQSLLEQQPDLMQKVPQKYIANMLGISPESLSRIRKRLYERKKS